MSKLLREPLVHFVFLGLIIYLAMNGIAPSTDAIGERSIRISNESLATFMQNRDQVFDAELYTTKVAALKPEQKGKLISQFVEQEVLFREAQKLGLEQNDQVMRRRLIQKLKYFLEGFANAEVRADQQQLLAYHQANQEDYINPAIISFSHVFFRADERDNAAAKQRATQSLSASESKPVAHTELGGDHFPYHRNYVGKTAAQIGRHFGQAFADQIFSLETQDSWQGPVTSAYGEHLVLVAGKQAAYLPEFEAVADRVKQDLERINYAKALQAQIDKLVAQYEVAVDP